MALALWIGGASSAAADAAALAATGREASRSGAERPPAETSVMPPGVRAYNVAMHLHGHSNHNAVVPGGQVASMQWHAAQAALHDDDAVLWWSDHLGMFDQSRTFVLSFREGSDVRVQSNLDVTGLSDDTSPAKVNRLKALGDPGGSTARLDGLGLAVELTGGPEEAWRAFTYEAQSGARDGLIHSQKFARPLSSGAVLELSLECDSPGPDAACEIEARLAWHYDGRPLQHVLRYRIDSEVEERLTSVTAPGEMLIRLPPRDDHTYRLDLLGDAGPLADGDDNTINRLSLGLRARRGATAAMTLWGVRLLSTRPAKHQQLAAVQGFAARYAEAYGQTHHVGLENGDRAAHVNAFFPSPLGRQDEALLESKIRYSVAHWVRAVRKLGGVVSLNHPFLRRNEICGPEAPDPTCIQAVARQLLDSRARDADLLEVGYLDRGMDLRGHLELWDRLTSNGLLLYGTGVTDSHGGQWEAQRNPMTTWVLASSSSAAELLDAVRGGRMYFGDPLVWNGVFGFRVGQAFMGDRLPSPGGTRELAFELDPWREDTRVFLVQGLIQPGPAVEYLHRHTPLARGVMQRIDTSRPSFVRLEAWQGDRDGERVPIAFTNPVVLHP